MTYSICLDKKKNENSHPSLCLIVFPDAPDGGICGMEDHTVLTVMTCLIFIWGWAGSVGVTYPSSQTKEAKSETSSRVQVGKDEFQIRLLLFSPQPLAAPDIQPRTLVL